MEELNNLEKFIADLRGAINVDDDVIGGYIYDTDDIYDLYATFDTKGFSEFNINEYDDDKNEFIITRCEFGTIGELANKFEKIYKAKDIDVIRQLDMLSFRRKEKEKKILKTSISYDDFNGCHYLFILARGLKKYRDILNSI